ncbi:MAG: hypothetical protein SFW08_14650 [Gemmatimonadaceae bacterium]|nr:hypothetical protein [Gemmatimonadaceae bacterium]
MTPPAGTGAAVISGAITSARTLSKDTVYTLRGFVYADSGAVLTIQAGTKIVGDTTVPGSALFVMPGARIEANGTAAEPIVFTSARSAGNRKPGDWGGLIIVGRASVNRTGSIIEGSNASITGGRPAGVGYTGRTNDADNSGTLRYVRVEFAGFGVATNQELNSFTLAAVGRGTTLEYLEALSGLDDHYEWFGGNADARFLVSYESGDDHYDASEGFRGRVQYLIAYQSAVLQPAAGTGSVSSDPQGFEVDGCDGTGCTATGTANAQSSTPYTMPVFANFTVIGAGTNFNSTSGNIGAVIRRGTGGVWVNGVIGRWSRWGVSMRDTTTQNRLTADSLNFRNVYLVESGPSNQPYDTASAPGLAFRNAVTAQNEIAAGTVTTASLFTAMPTAPAANAAVSGFDWQPGATSPLAAGGSGAFTALTGANGALIQNRVTNFFGGTLAGTTFRGAAAPGGTKWWQGWTSYARD